MEYPSFSTSVHFLSSISHLPASTHTSNPYTRSEWLPSDPSRSHLGEGLSFIGRHPLAGSQVCVPGNTWDLEISSYLTILVFWFFGSLLCTSSIWADKPWGWVIFEKKKPQRNHLHTPKRHVYLRSSCFGVASSMVLLLRYIFLSIFASMLDDLPF